MVFKKKKSAVLDKIDETVKNEVKTTVSKLTKDNVSNALANLQVTLNREVGEVASKFQEQLSVLEKVNSRISDVNLELEDLYKIKATATTLAEMEAEMASKREEWQKEQEETQLDREREESIYDYDLARERKENEDGWLSEFNQKKAGLEARELAIHNAEKELSDLISVREDLQKEKEKVRDLAIELNSYKKTVSHEKALSDQKYESEKSILNSELNSVRNQVANLNEANNQLRSEVEKARNDAKEVATRALESAGNRDTIAHLKAAMESQNASGSGKK